MYQIEKASWAEDDFDRMGWHGARVWALAFLILEPFGDSDCYWIVAETPSRAAAPLIERVESVFDAARAWP